MSDAGMRTSLPSSYPPSLYPKTRMDRDVWILARRPVRNALDPSQPYAFFVEDECSADGEIVSVATVFLTNRECPWRCLMCDLWKNTLTETVPGAIPSQIDYALEHLLPVRHIKLYNSGSFFDTRAIPLQDYPAILSRVASFERVIVECHPALVSESCFRFNDQLTGRLEVAMGLETVHPEILERLNKGMTSDQFATAASRLREHNIDLRVFILVKPPFMRQQEALYWAERSLDFAFACGATAATLIPTRPGNGALEELANLGDFSQPRLATLEAAVAYGISLNRGRVFADLWDGKPPTECPHCYPSRIARLRSMNLQQSISEPVSCPHCGGDN
jgi:archaeosine synthase beta-subunit